MLTTLKDEFSIIEFFKHFPTEDECEKLLEFIRWGDEIKCIYCESNRTKKLQGKTKRIKCFNCRKQFTVRTRTFLHDKKITSQQFLLNIYFNSNNRKSYSSRKLSKDIGLSQCASWYLQSLTRELFKQFPITLKGTIEIDEAFFGKGDKNKWTRWGAISTRKEPVIGLIERNGRVVLKVIEDRSRNTILNIIDKYVEHGSIIYTDGWKGYNDLPKHYTHDFVIHSSREYVDGDVHTNNIEAVWGFFKKSIRNAHHHVSAKHVQSYLDECAWKFNNRHLTTKDRFICLIETALNIYNKEIYEPKADISVNEIDENAFTKIDEKYSNFFQKNIPEPKSNLIKIKKDNLKDVLITLRKDINHRLNYKEINLWNEKDWSQYYDLKTAN